jgi:hypothetical protein
MNNRRKLACGIAGIAALVAVTALAQNTRYPYAVKTMPPAVIKTTPVAGATEVDPNLKEITVTFSKDMMDGNYSVPQTTPDENFPGLPGKIHYQADKRTCVVPVKLEPGRTYVVWFNHNPYMNFKDTEGKSAIPYLLVFETKK